MQLTRKSLSSGALTLLFVLFVALTLLSNQLLRGARLDLTEQNLYTLSPGARHILQGLDEPVRLTLYFSDKTAAASNRSDIQALRLYYERVREYLEEMAGLSDGKLQLQVIDPVAYSEDEDKAAAAGVQGLPLGSNGEKIFLGLVGANTTDGQAAIPFLDPNKESLLEYDVAKLIQNLGHPEKPKVGFISNVQLAGQFDRETMQMSESAVSYQQLTQQFDVKSLDPANLKSIPADINMLILAHPKNLNDDAQYAIDQFVLRGGRLLAIVDPDAENEQSFDPSGMQGLSEDKSSDLPALFKAWGVEYDPNKVVLDREHALMVTGTNGAPIRHPGILRFGRKELPQNEVVTANLDSLILSSAGAFKLAKDSPYTLTPLLQTGAQAMTIPAERMRNEARDPNALLSGFAPSGESYILAARLQGKFKTAFSSRSGEGHLAEAKENGEIVLFADSDWLNNRYWVRQQNFFGQKMVNPFANNGDLFVNTVDYLSGSSDLISIRGRGVSYRPFTLVERLKSAADDRFRVKEQELERELSDTEHKLVALQSAKSGDQKTLFSAEQQNELDNFLQRKLEIRKELRDVRRQLDADIDNLGAWLKFINIALLPILITLGSLIYLAWQARQRHA